MASIFHFSMHDATLALTASSSLRRFSLSEIEKATNNFDPDTKLHSSDSSSAKYVANISYYDTCRTSQELALALVNSYTHDYQFLNEVRMMTKIQLHKNLISLIGYCIASDKKILVFKYMENGSLYNYLNKATHKVWSWKKRVEICLQVAYGLQHLHSANTEFPDGIAHRGVKSTNILLDKNWDPIISNFARYNLCNISSTQWDLPKYKSQDVHDFGTLLIDVLRWETQYYSEFHRKYKADDFLALVKKEIALGSTDELSPDSLKAFSDALRRCLGQKNLNCVTINAVVLDLEAALNFQERFHPHPPKPIIIDLLDSSSSGSESTIMGEVWGTNWLDDLNSSSSCSFNVSSTSSSLRVLDLCQQFSLDKIKMATNNFDKEKCLGKGGEATVYRGEIYLHSKTEKSTVAVKHLKKGITSEFEKEIATVRKLRHPNIVSLFGYCKESDDNVLIYEYMGKGSLSNYVKMNSKVYLSWKRRLNICLDAAKGLQFLHKKTEKYPIGIIHRDVKPENILIDDNWVAKISDFGMLKLSNVNQTDSIVSTLNMKGTPGYFAPECIYLKKLSKKIDVYAFGFVMFEVLCRKKRWEVVGDKSIYPEDGDEIAYLIKENIDSTIKHEIMDGSQQVFIDIVAECMQYDPEKRPTMDKVVLKLEEALKFQEQSNKEQLKKKRRMMEEDARL